MPKPVKPKQESWFTIENKKSDKENRVIVNMHGYISSMWGVSAADLMTQVNGIDDIDVIEAHINSYGGEVFEGIAIYNWLRNHKASAETVIDSVAASIASVIFMAGKKRTIYDTSMGMIHLPTSISFGNSNQMRKDADDLDKIDQGTIRKAYRKGVGNKLSDDEIDEMMRDETWLDSDELLEYGFATDKLDSDDDEEAVADKLKAAANGLPLTGFGFNALPQQIYNVFKPEMQKPKNKNLVPVNNAAPPVAADNSQTKGGSMPQEAKNKQQEPQSGADPVNVDDVKKEAAKAERVRIETIKTTAESMGIADNEIVQKLIDDGTSIEDALKELNATKNLAKEQPENPAALTPQVDITTDDADNFRNGASLALCKGMGVPLSKEESESVAKSEMPTGLHSLMRKTLERAGVSASKIMQMNPTDLTRAALRVARNAASVGTGDLTNVLADAINKLIGMGYSAAPATWAAWAKVIPVSDFKNYNVVKISTFGDMETIPEGMPFTKGAISDKKEYAAVTVKGKSLTISWQTLVNDDKGGLARITSQMGAAYNWYQNKIFYDYLFGSAAVGPTLQEADSNGGYSAFTSYRGNFATGAGAPSVSTLSTARAAMRNQTAPKGEGSDTAQRLNLVPAFIISGTTNETTIEQLLMSRGVSVPIDPAQSISDVYNPFAPGGRTPLQIIIDAYLDSLSTTVWYLAANQSMIETMAMLALDGQVQPTVRSEESRVGEALGVNYDVYGAYAPFMVDFRGMYCHKGA